jgi:hypothetical protein
MRDRLDAIDWKILDELQKDGRITNASPRVISAPPYSRGGAYRPANPHTGKDPTGHVRQVHFEEADLTFR